MVRVGISGIGFMGMIHYLAYQKVPGAKVLAFCEQARHVGCRRVSTLASSDDIAQPVQNLCVAHGLSFW